MESACHDRPRNAPVVARLREALAAVPRTALSVLPTPVTRLSLHSGGTLLVKRDDLIGPGLGGNKVRKLEYLTADAVAGGADCLVTVGAAQSNHARLTAAAGAVLGLETHLVLGGTGGGSPEGNQLLAQLFGATLHFPGTDDWHELESAQDQLAETLRASGRQPYTMPIGGSTPVGALGFANAFDELMRQCADEGWQPSTLVHATSSGGTHAGLLAGRAAYAADGLPVPRILAISVAKQSGDLADTARALARSALDRLGLDDVPLDADAIEVDGGWRGPDYAVPTAEADDALRTAARSGALVLDRVYTAKAFAAALHAVSTAAAAPATGGELLFWHTGGQPAVFSQGGLPGAALPSTPTDDLTHPR
jgi:1-aminocyclopropane-1-carboxylate deaminase/D-cysteine desulfhydrase-like pyridoxal-dependent ACC family enzyme